MLKEGIRGLIYGTLLALMAIASLCSCHVTKSTQKSHTDTTQQTHIHATETQTAVTTSTLTETAHTIVTIPGDTIERVKAIDEIMAGDSIFEDTPDMETVTKFDAKTKKLKTVVISKPHSIPVYFNRVLVTTHQETTQAAQDITAKTHSVVNTKDSSKERQGWFKQIDPNWLWLLLVIAGIVWFVLRKKPDQKSGT